ncbi:gliding motility-associated C-terminal domain-containing protein [Muricauda sp. JGD-17]|uniref:Gliding motility-associated C-terminal domain-containing protein n=1 Tax=Flagellimonas ochracea TaxID=2696472 RepID=A0A964TB97_9FLAO|nr:gliding motility-associated C-terminal domain-containing protein [Allomuricauda ochracea]NAY91682.1 gliding motility-associated C-terminal domain-containing protein [Allomuricauda ochracea]
MKKRSSLCNILVLMLAIVFAGSSTVSSQVLNKPVAADNPNLGGNSPWTAACASSSFNEYFVNFTWSPPLVNSDNEFVLELSDANGNFGSPRELARASDKNNIFDFDFEFAVPTDIRGENYKMRVRSTSPAKTSPASDAYSMYFVDYNSPLLISQDGNGTIPPGGTIQLCGGASVTLAAHNIPNASSYQYNWYRSGTPLAEKSESITVSSAGMYYVELDYGSICSGSANTLSNTIEIITGSSLGVAINGSDNVGLCSGDSYTLQASITGMGLTYTWYKDNSIVAGPVLEGDSFAVNTSASGFDGNYEVEISGSGACLERSAPVTVNNLGNFEVTRQNASEIVLLPAQSAILSATTTATSPNYQWFKDGSPITGATNSTLNISETGNYFVRVTETSGGCSGSPVDSDTTTIVSPDSFEFVIAYVGAYTACESSDATLSLSAINAVSSSGAKTDVTSEVQSSFAYQWKKDGASIGGETSKTITLSSFEDNGGYTLEGVLDSFNAASNNLNVKLSTSEVLEISSNGTVLCDGAAPIVLTTSKDLTSETFQWLRNGQVVDSSAETLTADEVGDYQLVITTNDCPLNSNVITVNAFDESLLSLDKPQDLVIIEGETETVTASGGQSYEWFDSNNTLLGTQDFYSFQQEGEYLLVASFGNCTISRVITITYRDTFAVPNVITVNGDGINDLWVLPNTFSRNSDVLVTIYDETGKEIFSQANYENNWPQSTTTFNKSSMIFYYKITKGGSSLKQGTITVIR